MPELSHLQVVRLERQSLGDEVYRILRRMIVQQQLLPGAKIAEVSVAQLLGVSRTPVREAFQRLELEGWLVTRPGHSPRVAALTAQKVQEIYPLIAVLEGLAVRLALPHLTEKELRHMEGLTGQMARHAKRGEIAELLAADAQFHGVLHVGSRNQRLQRVVQDLRGQMERLEYAFFADRDAISGSLARHRWLVRLLRRGDPQAAQRAIENQWNIGRETLIEILRKKRLVKAEELEPMPGRKEASSRAS